MPDSSALSDPHTAAAREAGGPIGCTKATCPCQRRTLTRTFQGCSDPCLHGQVPIALAAAEPEARLKLGLKETGLEDAFQVVVSAEDMSRGSPDPEGYLLAAQQLGRPPVRCVVIGHSNQVLCLCVRGKAVDLGRCSMCSGACALPSRSLVQQPLPPLLELHPSLCSLCCVSSSFIEVAIHGTRQLQRGSQPALTHRQTIQDTCTVPNLVEVPVLLALSQAFQECSSCGAQLARGLQSVEAARECGMAAVVVAGRKPLYEMGAADLVVKQLDELSFKGLKKLFDMEGLVEPQVRAGYSICLGKAVLACHHPHTHQSARHMWVVLAGVHVRLVPGRSSLQLIFGPASVREPCARLRCRACKRAASWPAVRSVCAEGCFDCSCKSSWRRSQPSHPTAITKSGLPLVIWVVVVYNSM